MNKLRLVAFLILIETVVTSGIFSYFFFSARALGRQESEARVNLAALQSEQQAVIDAAKNAEREAQEEVSQKLNNVLGGGIETFSSADTDAYWRKQSELANKVSELQVTIQRTEAEIAPLRESQQNQKLRAWIFGLSALTSLMCCAVLFYLSGRRSQAAVA